MQEIGGITTSALWACIQTECSSVASTFHTSAQNRQDLERESKHAWGLTTRPLHLACEY